MKAFNEALYGKDPQTYYDMFDSQDSDTVIELLRKFHQTQSTSDGNALVAFLSVMLETHIKSI